MCDDGKGQQIQICVMPFADRIMVLLCHVKVGRPGTWVECTPKPTRVGRGGNGGGAGAGGAGASAGAAGKARERPRFTYNVMLGRREDPMVNLLSEKVAVAANSACEAKAAKARGESKGGEGAKKVTPPKRLRPVVVGVGLEGGKVDASIVRKVEEALLAQV